MGMDEHEFEDALLDILDNCEHCRGTTMSFHSAMCPNPEHQVLAKLVYEWPERLPDEEREDYEWRIRELEGDIWTHEALLTDEQDANAELRNRLKVWSTLSAESKPVSPERTW